MKATTLLLASILAMGLFGPFSAAQAAEEKCLKCHKRNGVMAGAHADVGKNGLACSRCHGEQAGHPRDKTVLRVFSQDSVTPVADQQKACLRCHRPDRLRRADWTHDVHKSELACASCHQLHPEADPMTGISAENRSQLCADCHGQQNTEAQP